MYMILVYMILKGKADYVGTLVSIISCPVFFSSFFFWFYLESFKFMANKAAANISKPIKYLIFVIAKHPDFFLI